MIKTVKILPGEHWWGGTTIHAFCPITDKSEYHQDFRISAGNQTMPGFISSLGRYIWIDGLFRVDVENGEFVFDCKGLELDESGSCLKDAFKNAQKKHFPCDKVELKEEFFTAPQYNCWIQFAYYPTQDGVLKYAREIVDNGYEPGVFIIDEGWHVHTDYGHWDFDFARFPEPKKMVDELHEMGFKVMLWVTPFVSPNGPRYFRSINPLVGTDPEAAKHLYKRNDKGEVAVIKWWNGYSAILDMTNNYDVDFLDKQLCYLIDEYGVDGFKFDGGATNQYTNSNIINGKYDETSDEEKSNRAWNEFGRRYPFHEYKDTYNGGGKNCIQRLHDRDHSWTNNGINELIPCAILCGLIGHPFICPDMIGGGEWRNRYTPGFEVDEELFVRMAQCSALFPMMQFSWAPWEALSEEYAKYCLDAAKLHLEFADELLALVKSAEQTGEPIIRSLDWAEPHKGYEAIVDEFLLGDDILVAPVVTKNTYKRDVVFPCGIWTDGEGNTFEGDRTYSLNAPIDKLLYFRRKK